MNAVTPLKERVLAAAAATPSLTRRQGRRLACFLAALSIAIAMATFEALGGMSHSYDRPLVWSVRLADGWGLVSAVLTSLLLGRGRSTVARSPRRLLVAALATPALLLAWMSAFHGLYAEPSVRDAWICLPYSFALGLTPLTSFLSMRRGIEPLYPATLGAAAGAVWGAWGAVVALLWCPLTNARHAIVGHVTPLALLVAVGAWAGKRMLGYAKSLGNPACPRT